MAYELRDSIPYEILRLEAKDLRRKLEIANALIDALQQERETGHVQTFCGVGMSEAASVVLDYILEKERKMSDGVTDKRSQPDEPIVDRLTSLINKKPSGADAVQVPVGWLKTACREINRLEMTDRRRQRLALRAASLVRDEYMLNDRSPHREAIGEWTINEMDKFMEGMATAISVALKEEFEK